MGYLSSDINGSSLHSAGRVSFLEYLFVFVLILYAGHANQFLASGSDLTNLAGFSIPLLLSGIMALKWRIPINREFYLLILCYFIYFLCISIKYSEFRPTFFINNVLLFFITYVTVKALKINFFRVYENLLYYLAIIGLLLWGIQIMLGGDVLYTFFSRVPSIEKFSYVSGNGLNTILYSVQPTSMSKQYEFLPPRNCGFAWEPGGFAVFLCLAIFINLFIFKKDKISKTRFWVLLIALISSQSTTGYAIFIIIILFYYINRKQKVIALLWPVILALIILIFSLPFMSDKIVSLASEAGAAQIMVENSIGKETSIAPQRFASFMIAIRDFIDNPILGLGGKADESWTFKIGANVSTITGIGNLLAQYGIVGFLFFIISAYKTSFFFSTTFKYRGRVLFLIIILFISVSYGIILLPLMMSFWLFRLFTPLGIDEKDPLIQGLGIKADLSSTANLQKET